MNAQSVVVALTHVLHEHECAVVPGFGAFILRKNFGVANPFSGQIKPASYSVYFNADIKEDDGFVANALKEKFGLSLNKQASYSQISWLRSTDKQVLMFISDSVYWVLSTATPWVNCSFWPIPT